MSVLLALHRVGPYHHARFQAAAQLLGQPLHVLETRPGSNEYPWKFSSDNQDYCMTRLSPNVDNPEDDLPGLQLKRQLASVLEQVKPRVVVTVGWADRAYLQLLLLAHQQNIPLVLISDSRSCDQPRLRIKEFVKAQILRGYSAAVVAGTQSGNYLHQLGFNRQGLFRPWDVVDNNLFSRLAKQYSSSGMSNRPFLCVGRFIAEKNHQLLLQAYSIYQNQGGRRALLLVGSGPLLNSLELQRQELFDPGSVSIIPFEQLKDLTKRYANSFALILASFKDTWGLVVNEAMSAGLPVIVSNACGCVDDLVIDQKTGLVFQSNSPIDLATCLWKLEHQSSFDRHEMIAQARLQVEQFKPSDFAEGLQRACNYAVINPKYSFRSQIASYIICKHLASS